MIKMSKQFDEACDMAYDVISIQDMTMAGILSIGGDLTSKMEVLKTITNKKTLIGLGSAKSGKYGSITVWKTKQNIFLVLYLFNSNEDYFSVTTDKKCNVNKIIEKLKFCYGRKKTPNTDDFKKYHIVNNEVKLNNSKSPEQILIDTFGEDAIEIMD